MSIRYGFSRGAALLVGLALARSAAAQVWEVRNWASHHGAAQSHEHFGAALAAGSFDGDAYDDLAAAAPDWDSTSIDTGKVALIYGSSEGLVAPFDDLFEFTSGFENHVGASLVAADFESISRTALVIGVPGRSDEAEQGGAFNVFVPCPGATCYEPHSFVPNLNLIGTSEPFDRFGRPLAVGRFNGDAYWDLAVGAPGENLESPPVVLDAGEVMIIYGSATGLDRTTAHLINENTGTLGGAQGSARFGSALASADFDGDGFHDLSVGVPDRDVIAGTFQEDAGEVVILFGGAGGLTTTGHQRLNEASLGQSVESGDRFGAALAAGDFNATILCLFETCYGDLAIGVPGQTDLGHQESGKIMVVDGSAAGLDPAERIFLFQDILGDGGSVPAPFDLFGSVLRAGSLDGRIGVDLMIGVPDENVGGNTDQGMVHLVFGGISGLVSSYIGQYLVQRTGLQSGPGAAGDRFGAAVAAGDFDGDDHPDLAIGAPGRAAPAEIDAGIVQILYGALFADGFESGGLDSWS